MAPQIKEFDAGIQGLRPTEVGVDATAGAARRIGSFSNQVAGSTADVGAEIGRELGSSIRMAGDQAVTFLQHREVSHGAAAYAGLNDQLTQTWNDIAKSADPNDPTVAAKFREQVLEPALDKFREGFLTEGGQQWAEARIDALRNHMFEKSAADMSSLAGKAVEMNVRQMSNTMSNTAIRDPSSTPHLLSTIDASVGAMVDSAPNLKGAEAAKVKMEIAERTKEGIVKSGAVGSIMNAADPESMAAEWSKRYPEYINGEEARMLASNARQQIRARNYDSELQRRRAKEIATDTSNQKTADYLVQVRSKDPRLANDPLAQKILNDPDLLKTDKNNLLNYLDRQLKPETDARISRQTFVDLLREMREPGADMDQVMQHAWDARLKDPGAAGSMTENDFNAVRQEVIGRRTPEGQQFAMLQDRFMKGVEHVIAPSTMLGGLHDPESAQRLYEFRYALDRKVQQYKREGKDPASLFDPGSPDYMGRREVIKQFQTPLVQQMSQISATFGGPGAPQPTADVHHAELASQFKNFFSSGRAAQRGITFNPSTDLAPINVGGQSAQVNKFAAPHFQAFLDDLAREGYSVKSLGGYADRNKVGASGKSEHAFGNAIDLNPGSNAQHSGKSDLPANVGILAARHGLIWGGNWKGASNDPMHFEWAGAPEAGRQNAQAAPRAPAVGAVMDGYRFNGGDPSKRENWVKQ